MKKWKYLLAVSMLVSGLCGCADTQNTAALPQPEITEGIRGEQFGIDKNINEETIDQYLNRSDSVYRDMRMLKDEADYEAIGGDSWLSGYVEGFEIVPYPYLVNVEGLPPEVGTSYSGPTLFTHRENGYTANYEEAEKILEDLFPKDKYIFLMCGGGGYAGMMKNMLVELGWDAGKIYNTGGFWFYQGEHAVSLKHEENGEVFYDFHKAPYHYIDFTALHPLDSYTAAGGSGNAETVEKPETLLEEITAERVMDLVHEKKTFALSIYLPGCMTCASFAPVAKEFADAGLIDFYSMNYNDAKEISDTIRDIQYAPSVILFTDGEVKAVLSPNKDADTQYFKSTGELSEWFHEHAGTAVISGTEQNDDTECEDACRVDFGLESESD